MTKMWQKEMFCKMSWNCGTSMELFFQPRNRYIYTLSKPKHKKFHGTITFFATEQKN